MIKLDILSDPICPWCYIGKSYLDRALEQRPDHALNVEWHPFQLNPDMPREGMDRTAYLEGKFGGPEGAASVYGKIAETARTAGLTKVDLDGIKRTPSTLDAHRLIHWAGLEGRQTPTVTRLFKAYFEENLDIGSADVLLDIAEAVGMDRAMTARLLEGDSDLEDIRARDTHARQHGVSGVPTFILANSHVLPGAQPPELWLQVLDEISEKLDQSG